MGVCVCESLARPGKAREITIIRVYSYAACRWRTRRLGTGCYVPVVHKTERVAVRNVPKVRFGENVNGDFLSAGRDDIADGESVFGKTVSD